MNHHAGAWNSLFKAAMTLMDRSHRRFLVGRPLPGAETLKHFSRANASYLVPVGTGMKLTAGLFNSFIGYESFYAKDNLNYTRAYLPDYSPYFMIGVSAEYQLRENLKHVLYVINGYNYLSRPNDLPSYGTQVSWKPTSRFTLTQNLYYGPDQSNTNLEYWRFFSDSIVEWRHDHLVLAMCYDIGTENAAELSGSPRTFWWGAHSISGGALPDPGRRLFDRNFIGTVMRGSPEPSNSLRRSRRRLNTSFLSLLLLRDYGWSTVTMIRSAHKADSSQEVKSAPVCQVSHTVSIC